MTRAITIAALALSGCSLVLAPSRHLGGAGMDGGAPPDGEIPRDAPLADGEVPPDAPIRDADLPDAPGCTNADADGDGWSECEGDCDDANPARYPDAPPICGNGVRESCSADARTALRGLLGDDLGIFTWSETLSSGAGTDLALALTNGHSDPFGHPMYAVLGTARPGGGGVDVRALDVAFGGVTEHSAADVFGATPPEVRFFSLGPANDFDGRQVYAARQGTDAPFGSAFGADSGGGTSYPLAGGLVTPGFALLTLPHALLSETVSTVIARDETGGVQLSIFDAATGVARGAPLMLAVSGVEHVASASPDGVILVQDPSSPVAASVHVLGGLTASVGGLSALAAPAGRDAAGEPVIVEAGSTLSISGTTCPAAGCVLESPPTTLHTRGASEAYLRVAGAPIPRGTELHGHAAGAVLRSVGGDVPILAITTAARAAVPASDTAAVLELANRPGGLVVDLEIAAGSQDYLFGTGGEIPARVTLVVVATLVQAGGSHHMMASAIVACSAP